MKTTGLTQYTPPLPSTVVLGHTPGPLKGLARGQSSLTGFDHFIFALDPSIRSASWVSQLTASPPFL